MRERETHDEIKSHFQSISRILHRLEDFLDVDDIESEMLDLESQFYVCSEKARDAIVPMSCELTRAKHSAFLSSLTRRFKKAVQTASIRCANQAEPEKRTLLNEQSSAASRQQFSAMHDEYNNDRARELLSMQSNMQDSAEIINQLHKIAQDHQNDFDIIENENIWTEQFVEKTNTELEETKNRVHRNRKYLLGIFLLALFIASVVTWAFAIPVISSAMNLLSNTMGTVTESVAIGTALLRGSAVPSALNGGLELDGILPPEDAATIYTEPREVPLTPDTGGIAGIEVHDQELTGSREDSLIHPIPWSDPETFNLDENPF